MVVLFSKVKNKWDDEILKAKISCLPILIQDKILCKHRWQDRQLEAVGKLLLLEIMKKYADESLLMDDLNYNQYLRPFFNADFDFNISHSGEIAVCAGSRLNKVGFDIEKVNDIDIYGFEFQFSKSEWGSIITSENVTEQFYQLWTRKEALAKAIGTGLNTDFKMLNITTDDVLYQGVNYHLQNISIATGYKACVATSNTREIITFSNYDI